MPYAAFPENVICGIIFSRPVATWSHICKGYWSNTSKNFCNSSNALDWEWRWDARSRTASPALMSMPHNLDHVIRTPIRFASALCMCPSLQNCNRLLKMFLSMNKLNGFVSSERKNSCELNLPAGAKVGWNTICWRWSSCQMYVYSLSEIAKVSNIVLYPHPLLYTQRQCLPLGISPSACALADV